MSDWRRGETVIVLTVNRGLRVGRASPDKTPWAGRVVGRSVLGDGWWLVRKINPKTGRAVATYTVPESEMRKP